MKSAAFHLESDSTEDVSNYSDETAHRGALIEEEERHLGLLASAKLHWRALLICAYHSIISSICILLTPLQVVHASRRLWPSAMTL
jgi:hypothetical protein